MMLSDDTKRMLLSVLSVFAICLGILAGSSLFRLAEAEGQNCNSRCQRVYEQCYVKSADPVACGQMRSNCLAQCQG